MFSKDKLRLIVAEFMGTAMLASAVLVVSNLFSLGTSAWYGALTAGVTLSLIVSIFGYVSGAHVNPAVTIALWTLRRVQTTNALVYIGAQMLGGATALLFFNYATGVSLEAADLGSFSWTIFWVETVGAALFGMGIAAALAQKLEGYHAAFTIGLSLTLGSMVASTASAGFLNPAVALANNSWSRTLAIAPVVGMVIGMQVYMALVAPSETTRKKKK